jgi:WD40 repeat protein
MGRLLCGWLLGLSLLAAGLALAQEKDNPDKGDTPPDPAEATGKPLLVLDVGGHTGPVRKVLFTRDDRQVITISQDKTVRFWDVETGQTLRVLRPPAGDGEAGALYAGALSPDGKTLAVAGWGLLIEGKRAAGVHLINLADNSLRTFAGHTGSVNALAFSPDGKTLASASDDKTARLWDVAEGTCLQALEGHTGSVLDVAFAPKGDRLATVSKDRLGMVWSVQTGKRELIFNKDTNTPWHVAWSPDGRNLITDRPGGPDIPPVLDVWEKGGNRRLQYGIFHGPPTVHRLVGFRGEAKSKESRQVVYHWLDQKGKGNWEFGVGYMDLDSHKSGKLFSAPEASAPTLMSTALSGDRKLGATSGGDNNQTYLWAADKPGDPLHLETRSQPPFSVQWGSADNKTTVAWGVATTKHGYHRPPLSATFDFADLTISANPDPAKFRGVQHRLASLSFWHQNDRVLILQRTTRFKADQHAAYLHLPRNNEDAYTLLSGDKLVVAVGETIFLYDARLAFEAKQPPIVPTNSRDLRRFAPHRGAVRALAGSPDGRFVASVSADQAIRITTVKDPTKPLVTLFVSGNEWVAWTPQGYYAASPGGERLMGWQVSNGPDKFASFYPASRFRASLYRPDVISRLLTEGSLEAALKAADDKKGVTKTEVIEVDEVLPPRATLVAPGVKGGKTASPTVEVEAAAEGAGKHPVVSLQLLLDGRPYQGGKGLRQVTAAPGAKVVQKWMVELPEGEHTLRVLARSAASMGLSDDLEITRGKPPESKHLYLLAVGINAYADKNIKLECAVNDARELEKTFKERSKEVFDVESRLLTDEQATRARVLAGLKWLKEKMKPQDQAVIFYAGHGEQDGKSFYLLPQDVDVKDLKKTGISGDELKQALTDMPGKVLLLLDACHSGAIGKVVNEMARDLADDDCGVVVMCAALGKETAGEANGHGFFCRALIEGLEGQGQKNKVDGRVYQHHLEQYVIDRVEVLSNKEQHPTTAKPTLPPFPLAKP